MQSCSPLSDDFLVQNLTLDGKFLSRSVWKYLRVKGTKVEWFDLVLGPLHISRHGFITWMAIQNRLSAKVRDLRENTLLLGFFISQPW